MSNHAQIIEAILYSEARDFSVAELAKLLQASKEDIQTALNELKENLGGHGLVLIQNNEEVSLGTHPNAATILESLRKEMLSKELTKAAAETLAIILYHPGITRPEIEFIRGVNATYSIRLLQIRGLIEQKQKEGDARVAAYSPTTDALRHFGVQNTVELPDFTELSTQLNQLLTKQL